MESQELSTLNFHRLLKVNKVTALELLVLCVHELEWVVSIKDTDTIRGMLIGEREYIEEIGGLHDV